MTKFLFRNAMMITLLALVVAACDNGTEDPTEATLTLHIENVYNGTALALNTDYTTGAGETVQFSHFRYWVSNIVLNKADGTTYTVPNAYYLMEVTADGNREMINLSGIPAGEYTGISFAVGVDPTANSSLDNKAGDLDETVGMSWTWNTGYIFLNAEGTYAATAGGTVPFAVHLGTDANYKVISKDFSETVTFAGEGAMVHVMANAAKLFDGFSWNELGVNGDGFSFVMVGPEDKATQMANNYAGMFMLHHAMGSGM